MTDIAYKLLHRNLTTYGGCRWVVGETKRTDGHGELCGPGWLHAYTHPLLAVLLNPIHANIQDPVLYRVAVGGQCREDHGLKIGYTEMTLLEELPLPEVTIEQRVRFALACAVAVYPEATYRQWSQWWVAGTDRTATAAEAAARAAEAALGASAAACSASAAACSAAEAALGASAAACSAARAANAAAWAATGIPLDLIAMAEWAMGDTNE